MGFVWIFFSHLLFLSSFSLFLGDSLISTEILLRAIKPETTNEMLLFSVKSGQILLHVHLNAFKRTDLNV